MTLDVTSKHFFFRPSRAHVIGPKKRRKKQTKCGVSRMWHKIGNSLALKANDRKTDRRKILVLYTGAGDKQEKTRWVIN